MNSENSAKEESGLSSFQGKLNYLGKQQPLTLLKNKQPTQWWSKFGRQNNQRKLTKASHSTLNMYKGLLPERLMPCSNRTTCSAAVKTKCSAQCSAHSPQPVIDKLVWRIHIKRHLGAWRGYDSGFMTTNISNVEWDHWGKPGNKCTAGTHPYYVHFKGCYFWKLH